MEKIKSYFSIFKHVDMFGVPIQLFFNEKRKYKSYFGAIVSTAVLVLSLYILISQLKSWLNRENSSTIYSVENFSVQSLLNQNRSIEYNLTNINYNIYFVVRADLPNSTILRNEQLRRYFTINYKYTEDADTSLDYNIIETEPCKVREANEFIMLAYDETAIEVNKTNPNRMCVKGPLFMGLRTDVATQNIKRPGLSFQISQCTNQTKNKNNFSCASENEIKEMMKYVIVQASIPQTLYDFKNITQPIKRMFKYEIYRLDCNLKKLLTYDINPTFLYKDNGFFNDDYLLDSVDFNPYQQTFDINTKSSDEVIFQYNLRISMQAEKYFIKNQKINYILSDFGGMINFLYTMGYLICFYLNRAFFTRTLVRSTFNIKSHSSKKLKLISNKKLSKKDSELIKKRNNSLDGSKFKYFLPFSFFFKCYESDKQKKEKELFEKSKELLYEYIDLKNVINRLQDVDKLKNILLNDSQRFFFDLIPKPEIRHEQHLKNTLKSKRNSFSVTHISKIKTKNLSNKMIFENYNEINKKGFSQIDDRIFLFLNDSTKKKINLQVENNMNETNSKYDKPKENLISKKLWK